MAEMVNRFEDRCGVQGEDVLIVGDKQGAVGRKPGAGARNSL